MDNQTKTLSISIMSGKGGVGKTNIALNLAFALHDEGANTLLIDCDLGLANLDVMLGIAPEGSLHDLLSRDAEIEDILFNLGEKGLDLIPAASGVTDLLELDEDQQDHVINKLDKILKRYKCLVLDIGAGISPTVQAFASMTHHQIVVITPEPTSLTDGYALIKVLYTQKKARNFHVLVNMVGSEQEAKTGFERLRAACDKFLNLRVNYLGFVRQDKSVPDAVRSQKPFIRFAPKSLPSKDIATIARRVVDLRKFSLDYISSSPVLKMDSFDK
ncbi:MinD/ParA family protein [Desulfonatronovibrio magnus]|uniref:MinD/ParA family protein n=1 Tax=Desulfonatronovibrio magnus TaxID=698827 RepID=UPI0005EB96A3|nr:MinD/ParA family protein [Desulfonatronovibrio magnus]RQD59721.1 MAG: MinD/ParA family protein [Desulfonatronovibrio sp. MSAO_Bac4]